MLADQGGELVDCHDQMGDVGLRWQGGDVLGTVLGQDPLASAHLGLQGGQRPLGTCRVQVGEDPGRVGQSGKRAEGGPSLVVDEDHGQAVRWVGQRQLHQPGDEQLGLSRSCCSGQQRVRAVHHQIGPYRPPRPDSQHCGQGRCPSSC